MGDLNKQYPIFDDVGLTVVLGCRNPPPARAVYQRTLLDRHYEKVIVYANGMRPPSQYLDKITTPFDVSCEIVIKDMLQELCSYQRTASKESGTLWIRD